ncbi:MAG: DUF5941 domain-containing protein [Streptosporangiaceae bacterium]
MEDPIGAGLNGSADSAESAAEDVIGGISAGPQEVVGALATVAATVDDLYNRTADWAERQSLAPASGAGISLTLGICAAGWFTAGTRTGNLYGALAIGVGYLVALAAREFLAPAQAMPSDLGGSARAAWLTMLGTRLSEYAVYVGLAIGAAAGGWHGVWPLTIAVLGLAAICDTMAVCSTPARPYRSQPEATQPEATVLDATEPGDPISPQEPGDLTDDGMAGDPALNDPELDQLRPGSIFGRVLLTALAMPPGGRILLVALAASVLGAQPALLGLLDWGIIAVGYGVGSRTAARRRERRAGRRVSATPDETVAGSMPASLAVLLVPQRPTKTAAPIAASPDDPELPVARGVPSRAGLVSSGAVSSDATMPDASMPGTVPELAGTLLGGSPDLGRPDLGRPDLDGEPAVSVAPGRSHARVGRDEDAVYDWADDGWTEDMADVVSTGPAIADDRSAADPVTHSATHGRGTGRGSVTDAELADQDEWDAELAATPQFTETDAALPGIPRSAEAPAEALVQAQVVQAQALFPAETPAGAPARARAEAAQVNRAGESKAGSPGDDRRRLAAVLRNRDDGTLSRWFGQLVRGQLMPLPPALLALVGVAMLARLGLRDLPGLLILAPAIVMLVAAPGASHRHDGRFDWLVPVVLQAAQYVYIAALGFAAGVPAPITFALCATIALHYADLGSLGSPVLRAVRRAGSPRVTRQRAVSARRLSARPARPRRSFQRLLGEHRSGRERPGREQAGGEQPRDRQRAGQRQATAELGTWMGWEGRMIVVGLGAAMGVAMFAYLALAGYLGWLIWGKIGATYFRHQEGGAR